MRLAQFITANTARIISEWEEFAGKCLPGMEPEQRRDHVAGLLKAIARDLETPQSKKEQAAKSKGEEDAHVDTQTAANSHGTDRAALGYTLEQMVSEFRALRASVLRLWSAAQNEFNRGTVEELTRFNEAIDQLLAESVARFSQDVDRSKDLFLGVLGHDLRNPLGAIMMSATVMMRKVGPDSPDHRTVSQILSSGMRMDQMISDLVDFTRTRLGSGIEVVRTDADIDVVCRTAVDEMMAFHPECVVSLDAAGDLAGQFDSGRLGQALSNLIGNAYQHGAPDSPIAVVARGERDRVSVTVHNMGPAIAKADLSDIFSPFRQLDASRAKSKEARSLGLGLYIAQAIVTAHEGTLGVDSTDKGTTFTMRLPRSAGSQPKPSK